MRRPRRFRSGGGPAAAALLAWVLLNAVSIGGWARAAEAGDAKAAGGAGASDVAAAREKEARARLEALERAMDRLAELLARTEPRNAAKLRLAFRRSRENLVREDMDRILAFLRARQLDRAIEHQEDVRADLRELLRILLEKDVEPADLLKAIRRLEGLLRDVEGLRRDEAAQKGATDKAAGGERDAIERLRDLVGREREIARKTGEAEGPLRGLAPEQADVRAKTDKLAGQLAGASESAEAPGGSKPSAGGAKASPGGSKASPGGSKSDPAPSLSRASQAMGDAEKALSGERKREALGAEKKAIEALEEALAEAEERLERLLRHDLREEEEGHKERADEIADRMKRPVPLMENPEGVPGRGNVQNASGAMGQASSSLSQGNASSASGSQKQAIDELDEARKRLEETLATLWQAFKDRLLEYLRQEFAAMLAEQKRISKGTEELDRRLAALEAEPARGDRQRARALSEGEGKLARRMDDVLEIVREDGTTVIFPQILEDVKKDMGEAEARLARIDTGAGTQRIQKEIERALADILEAIQEAQRNPPPPPPPQPGQPRSGVGPLLPGSAELRMIRDMEARVHDGTRDVEGARKPDGTLPPDRRPDLERLRKKQALTEELTRKLARRVGM